MIWDEIKQEGNNMKDDTFYLTEETDEGVRIYTTWVGEGPAPEGAEYVLRIPPDREGYQGVSLHIAADCEFNMGWAKRLAGALQMAIDG
jgi:hypothetical protein